MTCRKNNLKISWHAHFAWISKAEFILKDGSWLAPGKICKAGSKPETSAAIFHPGVTALLKPIIAATPARWAAWCQAWFEAVPKEGMLLLTNGLAQHPPLWDPGAWPRTCNSQQQTSTNHHGHALMTDMAPPPFISDLPHLQQKTTWETLGWSGTEQGLHENTEHVIHNKSLCSICVLLRNHAAQGKAEEQA